MRKAHGHRNCLERIHLVFIILMCHGEQLFFTSTKQAQDLSASKIEAVSWHLKTIANVQLIRCQEHQVGNKYESPTRVKSIGNYEKINLDKRQKHTRGFRFFDFVSLPHFSPNYQPPFLVSCYYSNFQLYTGYYHFYLLGIWILLPPFKESCTFLWLAVELFENPTDSFEAYFQEVLTVVLK